MKRNVWLLLVALAAGAGATSAPPGPEPQHPDSHRHFFEKVKPLLESRCINCHGPEKQKGSLRLDSRDATLRGGTLGPAVVARRPEQSLLLQAILHTKADLEMPPNEKLSPVEIAILERWIRDDVPWPESPAAPAQPNLSSAERIGDAWSDPRNPIRRIFLGQRLDLWSLKPPAAFPPPFGTSFRVPANRNPIDLYLQPAGDPPHPLPAPEADRRTIARRLHFDLTGLPPSPERIEQFIADPRPDAFDRLVDELLNSPRYGEHQARRWLDVIRYSDSNGFDWDEFRPEAWRFRDYVVRSFNADRPFNEFIEEQLAGDELLDGPPNDAREQDLLIATGYLRLGPQDNSAPLFNEQARARAEWLADLTETTGSAFLGLTLSCCRCHDHKYDPLSQADHFRIRAFFEPVRRADDVPIDLAADQAAIQAQHREIQDRVAPLSLQRSNLVSTVKNRLRQSRIATLPEEERRILALSSESQPQDLKAQMDGIAKKLEVSDAEAVKASSPDERAAYQKLTAAIESLEKTKRRFTHALLAADTREPVPPTRIHFQGDPKSEREAVSPGFLSILDPNPAAVQHPPNPNSSGRRLTLARWIASAENPLTARVYVNRAWQAMFGRGLVATPNDFGLAGARPSHPELLDWLARDFVQSGWSTKHLLRRIVSSAAYRSSSFTDAPVASQAAANRAQVDGFRQTLRRLTAEQLRDSLLSVAGSLQHPSGGPPAWPELPSDILQANPAFLDDNAEKTKGWYPSPIGERNVRTLFLVQKRTVKIPFLETFDLPDNSTSCPRRTESIVAPQALSLLNGPEALDAARAFSLRVGSEAAPDPASQIRHAFRLALQREPSPTELRRSEEFLARGSLFDLCRALLNLHEFAFID